MIWKLFNSFCETFFEIGTQEILYDFNHINKYKTFLSQTL